MGTIRQLASVQSGLLGFCFLLLSVLLLLAAIIIIPSIGPITTREHAVERHGNDAEIARDILQNSGPHNRWDCPDGRIRIVVGNGPEWAVGVYEGNIEVTAFLTISRDYIALMLEGCHNPWRMSHP